MLGSAQFNGYAMLKIHWFYAFGETCQVYETAPKRLRKMGLTWER